MTTDSPRGMRAAPSRILTAFGLAAAFLVAAGFAGRAGTDVSPRFNHVMLHVSDLEASIDFYTRAFGVEVTQRLNTITAVGPDGAESTNPVRMAFLKFPGQDFVLELAEQPSLLQGPSPLFQHLGVDVVDIEAAAERARVVGVRDYSGIRTVRGNTGVVAKNAFFRGPDGELLELMQVLAGEF